MRINKILKFATICMSFLLLFTGCAKKQIFKDKDAQWQLVPLSNEELEEGTYYVKDTSSFYAPYELDGTLTSSTTSVQEGLLWILEGESLIPSMYSDGILAYSTQDTALDATKLTRVKDIDFSIGVYNATIDANSYITLQLDSNCVKESNAFSVFSQAKSKNIKIVSINGEPVSISNLGDGGTITGLEEGKEYTIEYYAGSYFTTSKIKADTHFFSNFESYKLTDIESTKNGYFQILMPSDANNGFYYVENQGLFKYYNTTKSNTPDDVDMNAAYYNSLVDEIVANSQQYVINLSQDSDNVEFTVEYEYDETLEPEVRGILTAPDGEQYEMSVSYGIMVLDLETAMAGRWTLNIAPQSLVVTETSASSTATEDDATVETYEFNTSDGSSAQIIKVPYEGDGNIWGTVTDSTGSLVNFDVDTKNKILTARYSYMSADTYTVSIYHYADTNVNFEELTIENNLEDTDTEVTVIESD